MSVPAVSWKNTTLSIIDQTLLPGTVKHISLETTQDVWQAIKVLKVRGAPAIGICAAYGVLVGVQEKTPKDVPAALQCVVDSVDYLATSRPTAVNLFWALECMRKTAQEYASIQDVDTYFAKLEEEAIRLHQEEIRRCRAIGTHGAVLIQEGVGVLTHCNAGGLATGEYGTALAPMFHAHEAGRRFQVFADETRPLLQGARLTAWELQEAGIDVTVICDNMAAQVMREGRIQLVITGADRIAANGDTANKIGTYGVALLAHAHNIPFYIAAPASTFDAALSSGEGIPIEQRDAEEVTRGFGRLTAPEGVKVYNPAFDVTPASLITGIITEAGIIYPPYSDKIAELLSTKASGSEGVQ